MSKVIKNLMRWRTACVINKFLLNLYASNWTYRFFVIDYTQSSAKYVGLLRGACITRKNGNSHLMVKLVVILICDNLFYWFVIYIFQKQLYDKKIFNVCIFLLTNSGLLVTAANIYKECNWKYLRLMECNWHYIFKIEKLGSICTKNKLGGGDFWDE